MLALPRKGPLHGPVELEGAGWQYEETYSQPLAGLVKGCMDLGASVHPSAGSGFALEGLSPKGPALDDSLSYPMWGKAGEKQPKGFFSSFSASGVDQSFRRVVVLKLRHGHFIFCQGL